MTTPSFPPGYLEQDRGYQIVGVTTAMIVLITLLSILRLCSRRIQEKGLMWSDVFMPISYVCIVGVGIGTYLAVRWGAGKHIEALSLHDLRLFTITVRVPVVLFYLPAVTFPRLAILDLYLNIFVDKFTRYLTYLVGSIMVLSMIVNFVTELTQCTPFHESWAPVPGGHCNNIRLHLCYAAIPNIVTDVVILLLPIRAIWNLQTTWRTKVGINLTFLLGGLGLGASIARFIVFLRFSYNDSASDPTWEVTEDLVWVILEPVIYHVCACLLTLRPLFRWIFSEGRIRSLFSQLNTSFGKSQASRTVSNDSGTSSEHNKPESVSAASDDYIFGPRVKGSHAAYIAHSNSRDGEEDAVYGIHVRRNVEISSSHLNSAF